MLHLMEALPPELWAAYARARVERAALGDWPDLPELRRRAEEEGACPWALSALTVGLLPEMGYEDRRLLGGLASVFFDPERLMGRPLVLAPTPDTLLALQLAGERVYADVVDPWGRGVDRRDLQRAATRWREALHRGGRLAPKAYETDHLLPPAEARN